MGTAGMRASLVSREVIADSIELVARGHLFDGLVCLVACDKTIPGRGDGALSTRPARARPLHRLDRAGPLARPRRDDPGRLRADRRATPPGRSTPPTCTSWSPSPARAPAPAAASSPPTRWRRRSSSSGSAPPAQTTCPRWTPARRHARTRPAALAVDLVRRDVRPSQIVTREALENAAASVAATGGSTNGVLHLVAIARELRIPFSIDDFDADLGPDARRRRPEAVRALRRDRRPPRGRRRARRARAERSASSCTPARPTVDGRTLGEIADGAVETAGQEVVVPIERPLKPRGGIAVLRGNLAPEGAVVKLAGHDRLHAPRAGARVRFRGGMLRGSDGEADRAGRRRRHPLRRPARRARDARDAPRHRRHRRRGALGRRRARHRRPLLGRDARLHGRPRLPRGLRGRTARRAARRAIPS